LNAVPSTCEIYLDRRTIPGETAATVQREMDAIIEGKSASWAIGTLYLKSWTGMEIEYKPFHEPWKIDPNHELVIACTKAYQKNFGHQATEFGFWDFSTNAVTPVGMGIPTIGFGPGDYTLAHMRDENCPVDQIVDACRFYVRLIDEV
jgi:acetylornithine deacetylase/succinyl-diaminopimelate desuccinylase-like protein